MHNLALRFVRWGAGLLILGLVTGYGPLGHYLMGGAIPSCPSAPVHGHTTLLGWVGMTLFGLVYLALPAWQSSAPSLRVVRAHFWLSVVGTLGAWANGTFGYSILSLLFPRFYYEPNLSVLRVWFGISGLFLTLYGVGCALFLWLLLRSTRYGTEDDAVTPRSFVPSPS